MLIRVARLVLVLALCAPPAVLAADSVSGGLDEAGRAVVRDTEKGWEATKDASKHGWEKTKDGVGTALEKTGEGFDKAADGLDRAGEDVRD